MSEESITSALLSRRRIDTPDTISQALSELDSMGNRILRTVLIVLTGLAVGIAVVGFATYDPMNGSAMIGIAACLVVFRSILRRLPDTFRTIWNRNLLVLLRSGSAPADKSNKGQLRSPDAPPLEEMQFKNFLRNFGGLLNHWAQWFFGAGFSLIGVISWRLIYYSHKGFFLAVQPYSDLLANMKPVSQYIILSSAFAAEIFLGTLLGFVAWRMVVIALQIRRLCRDFGLQPQLLHPDRAGGFKPLGTICLLNATILTIPSIYLGAWIILAPTLFPERYGDQYTSLYFGLLLLTIALALITLFMPLLDEAATRRKKILNSV